jgi:hypothetical protein
MGRSRRQLLVDGATILCCCRVIFVIVSMVTGAWHRVLRRNGCAMIATTEYPVREHVQSGQDGDE